MFMFYHSHLTLHVLFKNNTFEYSKRFVKAIFIKLIHWKMYLVSGLLLSMEDHC